MERAAKQEEGGSLQININFGVTTRTASYGSTHQTWNFRVLSPFLASARSHTGDGFASAFNLYVGSVACCELSRRCLSVRSSSVRIIIITAGDAVAFFCCWTRKGGGPFILYLMMWCRTDFYRLDLSAGGWIRKKREPTERPHWRLGHTMLRAYPLILSL